MIIGERVRALREHKKLSQGEIERRCGLLRVYISRIENGHTVPAVETLEKLARALEVPLYQLFDEGDKPIEISSLPKGFRKKEWGGTGKEAKMFAKFYRLLARTTEKDRQLLLWVAQRMARSSRPKTKT